MSLAERFSFDELVNEAERLVLDELESQLSEREHDPSEEEVLDMAAYSLNHVRPRYRVNLLGRLYAQYPSEQYHAEVAAAVREAVDKVLSEPS